MEVTVSMESLNANAEEMQRIKDERDALAAHVQKMRDVIQLVCEQAFTPVPKDAADALERVWYEKSSIDTLLRLKAQWAAEGAQAAAEAIRMDYEGRIHADDIADFAEQVADDYRRQAQEHS